MQARLEPGDTVECRDIDDMIARSSELEKQDIHVDWSPEEIVHGKYILHVTDKNYRKVEP